MSSEYLIQITSDEVNFVETRRWILAQTFFIHKLARYLRSELQIPLNGFPTDEEAIEWEKGHKTIFHPDTWPNKKEFGKKSVIRKWLELQASINQNKREVFKPIYDAIDKYGFLQLEFQFLRAITLGYKSLHFAIADFLEDDQVYKVWSSGVPIVETGVYIKYTPGLSNHEVATLKKKAQYEYNRMFNFSKLPLNGEETRKRNDSPERVGTYYLPVEDVCIQAYDDNKQLFIKQFKLSTAFKHIADDLNVKVSVVRNNYYRIQNKFYLPSIPDASHIPTL